MTISRRSIIIATVAALGAAGFALTRIFRSGPPVKALTAAEKAVCGLTIQATEGPYWISDMQELNNGNLNFANLPGEAIEVTGHVYDGIDASKPIANAEVEIWHADTAGVYHPNGNGHTSVYKPEDLALRGFVKTDAQGEYRFTTIYAGEYTGRTRHMHFKIRAPGKPVLTTQLIIPAKPGDTLTFDSDDIAEGLPNCQLLTLDETTSPARGKFDFRV
jgi:protocatechuate 3,4-dioxygenase beta subunit